MIGCLREASQHVSRIRQHVSKFIRTGQIPNSRNISIRYCKFSTPVMFSDVLQPQLCLVTFFNPSYV